MRVLTLPTSPVIRLYSLVFVALVVLSACGPRLAENPLSHDHLERVEARNKRFLEGIPSLRELVQKDIIDPQGGLTRNDYLNSFQPGRNALDRYVTPGNATDLPRAKQFMVAPKAPVIAEDKLVTLSVTDSVPLKEVLIELSRRADVDVEIDPKIRGGIIFRAKDRPFSEVIERIAEMTGLRYQVKNGVLRIERDIPFIRNYNLSLLNTVRNASSSVNINTNLLSGGGGGESGGSDFNSGSSAQISSATSDNDVWLQVEQGVANILGSVSNSLQQERIVEVEREASLQGVADTLGGGSRDESRPSSASTLLSINRQAGLVTVLASHKQHEVIAEYLNRIHTSMSSQVLIEAKVLEVSLDDEFRSGVNWDLLDESSSLFANTAGAAGTARSAFDAAGNFAADALSNNVSGGFSVNVLGKGLFGSDDLDLGATVSLVERFGTTRTLSSPRLHAMNNQYAVLTFAENFVYFELDIEEEEEANTTGAPDETITINSEIRTVPIGVLLALQPSIDLDRNEVVMNVRPTLSRVTGTVSDPGVEIIAQRNNITGLTSNIPVVEVRELDSVLRLRSGQVMVIGGLMEERVVNDDTGVPGASKIPLLGNAFKRVNKVTNTVETVIFIKATIIPGQGISVDDQNFYNKFTSHSL